MSPPTLHARLGASGANRWMNCPGSIRLTEGIEDPGSPYAWEGTAAHELGEHCIHTGRSPFDYEGKTIPVEISDEASIDIEVTHEMCEAVSVFVDHVLERVDRNPGAILHVERRGSLEKLNPPAPMFGTADVVLWDPANEYMEVIDYKHGRGVVVEAVENPQLMYYALIAAVAEGKVPKRIRNTVVQPRAYHEDGPVRSYEYSDQRLIGFKRELFAAAERTQEEDAELKVGDWCKFCLAKATCPAQKEHAVALIGSDFDYAVAPTPPAPETLTPDDLGVILHRAGLVMDWIREVESHALAFVEQGGEIPGFKLVEKRTNRRWKDEEAAENYLARRGLRKEERTKSKIVSPNQAEAALKRRGLEPKRLENHWEKPEGAPKLVPVDDPRPEIKPAVEQDFNLLPPPQETEQSSSKD